MLFNFQEDIDQAPEETRSEYNAYFTIQIKQKYLFVTLISQAISCINILFRDGSILHFVLGY